MVFLNPLSYTMHVKTHQPWLKCDKCPFKTKIGLKLNWHKIIHKRNPDHKCFKCHKFYTRIESLQLHQKKMHSIYECKYCGKQWLESEGLRNHMLEINAIAGKLPNCWIERSLRKKNPLDPETIDIDDSPPSRSSRHAIGEVTQILKEHEEPDKDMARDPLSVLPELYVKQEKESYEDGRPTSAPSDLPSTFPANMESSDLQQPPPQVVNTHTPELSSFTSNASLPSGSTVPLLKPVTQQPLQFIMPYFILQPQPGSASDDEKSANTLTLAQSYVSNVQGLGSSSGLSSFSPVVSPIPPFNPLSTVTQAPSEMMVSGSGTTAKGSTASHDNTPSLISITSSSSESTSQIGTVRSSLTKEGKLSKELFCCTLCPCAFTTSVDFQRHKNRAHGDEPVMTFPTPWKAHESEPLTRFPVSEDKSVVKLPLLERLHNDDANMKLPIPKICLKQVFQQPKENVTRRPRGPRKKVNFTCDMCPEVHSSAKSLAKHKKLKHKKAYECADCNIVMRNHYKLLRHQKVVHKDKFRCRYFCGKLFDTDEDLYLHYRRDHKKRYRKQECPHCLKVFIYEASLMNHLEKCQECPPEKRPAHVCGNCEGFFPNIEAYKTHAKNCPKDSKQSTKNEAPSTPSERKKRKALDADIGEEKLMTQKDADKEETEPKENSTMKPHNTDQGDSSDTSESEDLDSSGGEASSDEYIPPTPSTGRQRGASSDRILCKLCPGVYVKKGNAIGHILCCHADLAKNMMVGPSKCEVCGLIYKNTTCLCKHLMKHYSKMNNWDAFVPKDIMNIVKVQGYCWICKTHQSSQSLSHALQRNIVIDEALEVEEIVNTEMKPLKCDKCDELFTTRKGFWNHVKVHLEELPAGLVHYSSDEKLFECSKCQFRCQDRDGFYQHITNHFMITEEEATQESKKDDAEVDDKKNSEVAKGDTEMQKVQQAGQKSDVEASRKDGVEGSGKSVENSENDDVVRHVYDVEDSDDDGSRSDDAPDSENDVEIISDSGDS